MKECDIMIVTLNENIKPNEIEDFKEYLNNKNVNIEEINCDRKKMYLLSGSVHTLDEQSILSFPNVASCVRLSKLYKLASRDYKQENTIVDVDGVKIGGDKVVFISGPCSVESFDSLFTIAKELKEYSVDILRAGAFKPRTSPYFFQGLGEEGIKILSDVKEKINMPIITEITDINNLPLYKNVDIIQVGARNMKNYELLKALGRQNKPVLIKRGPDATIEELLLACEYVLLEGNPNVIICERGIRSFDKHTRYILDLSSVPLLKKLTHLPVVVDPSHACGDYELVSSMILASVACGADGVMIESHNNPKHSYSDGNQALKTSKLKDVIKKANEISKIIGRKN